MILSPTRLSLGPVVKGHETYCVPAALSAMTGVSVDRIAEAIWTIRMASGKKVNDQNRAKIQKCLAEGPSAGKLPKVCGVWYFETAEVLRKMGIPFSVVWNTEEIAHSFYTAEEVQQMVEKKQKNRWSSRVKNYDVSCTVAALVQRTSGQTRLVRSTQVRIRPNGNGTAREVSSLDLLRKPMLISTAGHMIAVEGRYWVDNGNPTPSLVAGSRYRKNQIKTLIVLGEIK